MQLLTTANQSTLRRHYQPVQVETNDQSSYRPSRLYKALNFIELDGLEVVNTHEMSDKPGGDHDTLESRLGFLVSHIRHIHPVERPFSHADHVLATAGAAAVLARQQEAALVAQLRTAVQVANGHKQRYGDDDKCSPFSHEQFILCRLYTHITQYRLITILPYNVIINLGL